MQINIQTPSKTYPVYLGPEAMKHLTKYLQKRNYTKILVITDEIVANLHLDVLKQALPPSIESISYQVPSGEKAKQFSVYEACLTYALEQGLDRNSCIIAFGGGAVGDLSGFVAATYMRGIPFIQVPTTILAHDSAVGGKTGINHPLGKNMVGAFHQPEAVVYHTDFLQTLPESEVRSGFAEAVKHALIADPELLNFLMKNISDLKNIDQDHLIYILKRGIEIKAEVVSKDEKESGMRAVLNLGHTLGHVIEASAGYGKITHGEAVMTGIVYALYLSKEELGFSFPISQLESWINSLGYRLEIPSTLDFDNALSGMKRDKKSLGNKPRFVLLEKIGTPIVKEIEEDVLRNVFLSFLSRCQLNNR
ncbi:3-dehydroquinate synthase [Lederbergia citrea]|uniref:3-dehydroquinate synthase n=1 Tax=Lederbergia citrea TaxID=2833581 RepID=A0A942UK74_9BACI|nr:3-dehydroquinate synthase [Lederbergia citrea]MBS4176567.1 3-dehydroquinate synthase [Lederbergia citrea]MBS4203128.1 3-dehydroquinate synthase [Lederbergia citrea]MBS4222200.1 3-dehydroquinate synthase [Lederbergia citrea]